MFTMLTAVTQSGRAVCRPGLLLSAVIGLFGSAAHGQTMVTTTVPLQTSSDAFFESTNVFWSVRGPHFFAAFGHPGAGPAFGGYVPGAGLSSGWSVRNRGFSTNFGFESSQGFQRTSTTTAATVTSLDGYPASIFAGTVRPYVASVVPVVSSGGTFSVPPGWLIRQQQLRNLDMPESAADPVLEAVAAELRAEQARQNGRPHRPAMPAVGDVVENGQPTDNSGRNSASNQANEATQTRRSTAQRFFKIR